MIKRLITISLVVSGLLWFTHGLTAQVKKPEPVKYGETVISMQMDSYRAYLENNGPLDRLYAWQGTGFFLVNPQELKAVQQSGAKISMRQSAQAFMKTFSPPKVEADTGQDSDVNGAYHTYLETRTELMELAENHPSLAQVTTIGNSEEGRELVMIKISDNPGSEENASEPNIYFIGCHHAREWISVEVTLRFARYLLENFDSNPDVQRAVRGAQIYILPVLNPDGLEYTIHTYRMWRKNRRYTGDFAWGVDLNRNYGYFWGYDDEGSSPSPWSAVFRGPFPFSEPETAALADFILAHPPAGMLSFHNYSQIIIYPWGYTYDAPPDVGELHAIAQEMSDRMYAVNGNRYDTGGSEILYLVNGDTNDWIYGTFGAPSYTVELPPLEFTQGGFITPDSIIEPTVSENLPAMLYFANYFISDQNTNQREPDNRDIRKPILKGK